MQNENLKREIVYLHGSIQNAAKVLQITRNGLYYIIQKNVDDYNLEDLKKLKKVLPERIYNEIKNRILSNIEGIE